MCAVRRVSACAVRVSVCAVSVARRLCVLSSMSLGGTVGRGPEQQSPRPPHGTMPLLSKKNMLILGSVCFSLYQFNKHHKKASRASGTYQLGSAKRLIAQSIDP